jgi:hypothetical protein
MMTRSKKSRGKRENSQKLQIPEGRILVRCQDPGSMSQFSVTYRFHFH